MNCEECPYINYCNNRALDAEDDVARRREAQVEESADAAMSEAQLGILMDRTENPMLLDLLSEDQLEELKRRQVAAQEAEREAALASEESHEATTKAIEAKETLAKTYRSEADETRTACGDRGPRTVRRWTLVGRKVIRCRVSGYPSTFHYEIEQTE